MPAERVGALLHCPWHAVRTRQPIEVTIGILSRMKTVVGIRLHSLMFSAGQGVPGRRHELRYQGGRLSEIYRQPHLPAAFVRQGGAAVPPHRRVRPPVRSITRLHRHLAEMLRERESDNVKGGSEAADISMKTKP